MEQGGIIRHDIKKSPKIGDWKFMQPAINEKKCASCGVCVSFCPEATISIRKSERKNTLVGRNKNLSDKNQKLVEINIDYDFCKGCGVCAAVCPVKAIIMKKVQL